MKWGQFSIWEVYEWVMFFTWPSIWMGWGSGTPAAHPYPKSWQVTPPPPWKIISTLPYALLLCSELLCFYVIIACLPAFRCKIPWLPNDTYAIQSDAHASIVNDTIPLMADGTYDSCHVTINGSTHTCSGWVFDNSVFTNTARSQVRLFYAYYLLSVRTFLIHFVYDSKSINNT